MNNPVQASYVLDLAADVIESKTTEYGYAEASSLTRLLRMVGEPQNRLQDPDREFDPKTNPKVIDYEVTVPFAIFTAWKSVIDDKPVDKATNWARNRSLLNTLNSKHMGVYKLVGYWQNPPEGMTYDEAREQNKLLPPSREESFFVTKPKDMEFEEFEKFIKGLAFSPDIDQWSYLISDGHEVFEVSRAARKSLGNRLIMPKIQQAYSRMRGYGDKPFVFAGVITPDSISQMRFFQHIGLSWIPRNR